MRKGAIIGFDIYNPVSSVISFHYNPEKLTRNLQVQTAEASGKKNGDRSEALRLKGPPIETISLELVLDAADQLEVAESNAVDMGVYPQLSALEMLIYPKSLEVLTNKSLLSGGVLEIVPSMAPLTLFVWGKKRIVPVRITNFSITEEAYDSDLNPIRAKVTLSLRVLNYNDLPFTNPGFYLFMAHQVVKEVMATQSSIKDMSKMKETFF